MSFGLYWEAARLYALYLRAGMSQEQAMTCYGNFLDPQILKHAGQAVEKAWRVRKKEGMKRKEFVSHLCQELKVLSDGR
jgi:hypothetical protein